MSPDSTVRTSAIDSAGRKPTGLIAMVLDWMGKIPHSVVAFIARFSIAAVFWNSGQTKIDGLAINFVSGEFKLGLPHLSESAVALFKDEYKLPLLAPELAAPLAAFAEHLLPILILIGFATRLSALGLLCMTLVIQIFVYPGAYATHGTWAAVLLYLMARGPGVMSADHWLAGRYGVSR
jgi:putative oxidoreductase